MAIYIEKYLLLHPLICGDEFLKGQIGIRFENFGVSAILQALYAERGFGCGICRCNCAFGAQQQQACGHIARNFFSDALGFACAFLLDAMQPGELAFLRAQFFDYALHRSGHERGGIIFACFRGGPISAGIGFMLAQKFANGAPYEQHATDYDYERCAN